MQLVKEVMREAVQGLNRQQNLQFRHGEGCTFTRNVGVDAMGPFPCPPLYLLPIASLVVGAKLLQVGLRSLNQLA